MRKAGHKHFISKAWQLLFAMAMLIVLTLGLGPGNATASQTNPPESSGIQGLIDDTDGAVEISFNRATGVVSFVRMPHGVAMPSSLSRSVSPIASADTFFKQYGSAFGIKNPDSELVFVNASANPMGSAQLTFQQLYEDVPVFAAILKARFNEQNQMTSVNGTFVPKISLKSTTPDLSVREADQIAVQAVAAEDSARLGAEAGSSQDLEAVSTEMYVFRTGLVQGVPGRDHLVYEVEVTNSNITIREFVYVDAHTGAIVDQITGIYHGLDREVSETSLANVIWVEGNDDPIPAGWAGGTPQQVTDWQNEIDGARETYNIFASMAGWDSYDNAGATMRTVNNDPFISCPNATWNGTSTNYCSDVTGDDTVAHEWGHAYTEFTNNLIYQWQSGALSESYSDIWGDAVDLLNGRGTDTPDVVRPSNYCSSNVAGANFPGNPTIDTVRWLSGEDDPAFFGSPAGSGNAIRDLWDPTCFGDPGKVPDTEYWCESGDSGGVHTNSGVPNHAFALLVDGGTYNGQTVSAIGLTKAAHIHWGAQTMLTPASNFFDHADALEAACSALIGIDLPALSTDFTDAGLSGEIITSADCTEVADAIAAVELRTEPTQCDFGPLLDPDEPPLCEGLGTVQSIASEDWEGGSLPAGWTVGTHSVANPPTFDTPDWSVVNGLPTGANGTYAAFVPDLVIGDCGLDDESGALFLDSPSITVPADVIAHVAFDHWVATEVGWDGGNLKVSVNGGPWTVVPPDRFEFNPYNTNLNPAPGNTNPLASQAAFTGTDGGSVGGSWGQSQVNLIGLAAPGDAVQLRFDFGIDGCNGLVGWYVDNIDVYSCSDEQPPICGDGILDPGESCDDGNSLDGDGCSSTCQVEAGWLCEDPTLPSPGTNVIADGSFETGTPNASWAEFSQNFGTPLCTVGTCGTGTGTGPSDGAWWTWFGGLAAYEEGSVSQSVTIPSTSTDLTFDLEQIVCDSGADYMEMLVDGNQEFLTDGSSSLCGTLGYAMQTVDLSSYADGGAHSLEFHSEIFANNGGGSNFFLDDVLLSDNVPVGGSPSVCTKPIEDLACNGGTIGFDLGIPSTWLVVDNAGTGMVWTNIAGAGEVGNYTGGAGDAATSSSDVFGPAPFDTELRSNTFSLSDAASASLGYLANYQIFLTSEFLDLDISTDGGATWANLLSWNEDHGSFRSTPGEAVAIDLSSYVGMSNLQLRWRYYDPDPGAWGWYAQVDHVELGCVLYQPISIDIKPGSDPNSINLGSRGNVPVAVLTTSDFDATTVDPVTVEFSGALPLRWTQEDVDGDGDMDLLFHFKTRELNLDENSTEATLTGETFDGVPIRGTDSVHIVP